LEIPEAHVIVDAGDFTENGTKVRTFNFLEWFSQLLHKHKILIVGNHDFYLKKKTVIILMQQFQTINYLMDSSISIENVNF
jgi:metallophosphoesterase superfamily enzyme